MLRLHVAGFSHLLRRLALHSVHMSKRGKEGLATSSEPAAKRQRLTTSGAFPSEDVKVEAPLCQLSYS